jgi:hypothetical protein
MAKQRGNYRQFIYPSRANSLKTKKMLCPCSMYWLKILKKRKATQGVKMKIML